VQRFLLLIFVILNIGQLSELVFEIWVFLLEFLFEDLLNANTGFFMKCDGILLLEIFDVLDLIWHEETEGGTLCGNSGRSTHSVNIFLNVAA
jgi:hypothetical protein